MVRTFVCAILIILFSCQSKTGEIYSTAEGAINGYDPVAYFKEGRPVKGQEKYVTEWKDAKWYFSSQTNLEAFDLNPLKYAPQYGGFCAFGTAGGYKASTEPDAWTIVDDKLYLNYNTDVKREWMKDQTRLIHKADSNWVTVRQTAFSE